MIYSFIFSLFFTIFLIPIAKRIGIKYKIVDLPDHRKVHKKPKVRIGGLAIFLGVIGTIFFKKLILEHSYFNFDDDKELLIFLFAASSFFLIGFLDDLYKLSAYLRLSFQIIVSSIVWHFGFGFFNIGFSIDSSNFINIGLTPFFSFLITVLWISGMINAINWIDGLDGLAIGFSIISSISFLCISILLSNELTILISTSLLGASLAFLIFNYPPSKILMGDGGSYFLGFTFSSLGIMGSNIDNFEVSNSNLILLPLFIFIVPIFDASFVILKRIFNKSSPFKPDRNHIHHRLIDMGYRHGETTQLILNISLLTSSIGLSFLNNRVSLIFFLISLLVFLLIFLKKLKLNNT